MMHIANILKRIHHLPEKHQKKKLMIFATNFGILVTNLVKK